MQLETYISDLLYRYECVVITDFGAFVTQRESANVSNISHTFYPPKKRVLFNEQIRKNDGLLANYIADVEKTPFENANKIIAKRVATLKSRLSKGETITFDNIGDLVLNSEEKIVFEPANTHNFLVDAFGLTQFVSPEITREAYKEKIETLEKVVPLTVTPEKRQSKSYFKYAAVALIALTLGGYVTSSYYSKTVENHNQLAQEEATKQLENKIQQATFSLNPLPAITLNVTKQTGKYHIIAGAFRVEENSNKKVEQLRTEGFNTARNIGLNKHGLHQVTYASYETRREALNALRAIKNTKNEDAWMLIQTLD
ncbi:MAG: SPOR domain-containing protein [Aestuariibaculum sp.]